MQTRIPGIHHVTAIGGDPRRNLAFYSQTLGLRLVKRTVNFDDPGTHHLYFGDEQGRPGSILTFFPWPGAPGGHRGAGQVTTTTLAVPSGTMGWWTERLRAAGVEMEAPETRFGEETLTFYDPDGLRLALTASPSADRHPGRDGGPVPAEHAIRSVHAVTLTLSTIKPTASVLETMGYRLTAQEDTLTRYTADEDAPGHLVDLLHAPGETRGQVLAGTVHHVAFRTPDDAQQAAWRETLAGQGLYVTPVRDRCYFRSIYFREPGGVLFEIATDPPGFTTDETVEQLGSALRLPSWLEPQRASLEAALPPLGLPGEKQEAAA